MSPQETLYPRALVLSTRGSKLAVQNAPGGEIAFEDLKCVVVGWLVGVVCVCVVGNGGWGVGGMCIERWMHT